MSQPYPKIENLYKRGDDHFVTNEVRCREFNQIWSWLVTEKIDGTNIRVVVEVDPECGQNHPGMENCWKVRFHGRTDNAQIPTFLLSYLQDTFTLEKMQNLWRGKNGCGMCNGSGVRAWRYGEGSVRCSCVEPYQITLYGEGYGERIQKGGGNYRRGVSFRLFDVLVGDKYWLEWKNVCDIADKLGIKTVPILREVADRAEICRLVEGGFASAVSSAEFTRWQKEGIRRAEGIVARTDPYLYDSRGRPVRFKLKTKDFAKEAT